MFRGDGAEEENECCYFAATQYKQQVYRAN